MPNIDNLEKKPFIKNYRDNLLNVHQSEIFHRKDLRDGFFMPFLVLQLLSLSLVVFMSLVNNYLNKS